MRDAHGTRVKRTTSAEATLCIGGLYERRDPGTTLPTHVYKIVADGDLVATVSFTEETQERTVRYHLSGPKASSAITLDEEGNVEEALQFSPYGQRMSPTRTPCPFGDRPRVLDEGYTGHIHDDLLGLIDIKGRSFDPTTRHFLSLDPLPDFEAAGRGLVRTAYVGWDPLNNTDPFGFQNEGIPESNKVHMTITASPSAPTDLVEVPESYADLTLTDTGVDPVTIPTSPATSNTGQPNPLWQVRLMDHFKDGTFTLRVDIE
ncbi:MAG: RHS repeat-associated core domain-containing protein [Myxococcota bacterium]